VLVSVESHFAAALRALLAPGVHVFTGPAPRVAVTASVQVTVRRLSLAPASEDLGDERGGARHFTLQTWPCDGRSTVFPLPPGDAEIAEVEAPPGRARHRGDDFFIEAGALRFVHPPAAGPAGVRALLLGAPARGFVERRRGELSLVLSVRAADSIDGIDGVDELVAAALAAALRACVDLPAFEAAPTEDVRVRLRRPVAALVGVTRASERVGDGIRAGCDIELVMRGELELTVAAGVPDPVDRIAAVTPGVLDLG